MVIAIVATLHVLVAHYAVGGGFFLARELSHAYQTEDRQYLQYLRKHAAFFILLTVVFGAITGVGIWWTIGLASPLATGLLIQIFVFGWATEWVFFVIELTSAFLLYYAWGRIPAWLHRSLAWIYAIAAWVSLVLITGITSFMLHSGNWPETRNFWDGFFNPQFWPQVITRTGGAFLLASLYVYFHASLFLKDARLRNMVQSRSGLPSFLGVALIALGGILWLVLLPEAPRATILASPVLTVLTVLLLALFVMISAAVYFGPIRFPEWLSPGFASLLLLMGLAAFSLGEFIREAVRKPYLIHNVALGSQVLVEEVPRLRQEGYLQAGVWTRYYVSQKFPSVMDGQRIDYSRFGDLSPQERQAIGQVLFMHHCNDCHALGVGYTGVTPLIRGMDKDALKELILRLNEPYFYMPPWCGREEEAEVLAEYLASVAPPLPGGTLPSRQVSASNSPRSAEATAPAGSSVSVAVD
jgi:cytochrome bd-type quinol oxidase subunit 1